MEPLHNHQNLIQTVLALAEDNVRQGLGGPFAALVVKDGIIIGFPLTLQPGKRTRPFFSPQRLQPPGCAK